MCENSPSCTVRGGEFCYCYVASGFGSVAAVRRFGKRTHIGVQPTVCSRLTLPREPGEVDLVLRMPHTPRPGLWVLGQGEPVTHYRISRLQDARAPVLRRSRSLPRVHQVVDEGVVIPLAHF